MGEPKATVRSGVLSERQHPERERRVPDVTGCTNATVTRTVILIMGGLGRVGNFLRSLINDYMNMRGRNDKLDASFFSRVIARNCCSCHDTTSQVRAHLRKVVCGTFPALCRRHRIFRSGTGCALSPTLHNTLSGMHHFQCVSYSMTYQSLMSFHSTCHATACASVSLSFPIF